MLLLVTFCQQLGSHMQVARDFVQEQMMAAAEAQENVLRPDDLVSVGAIGTLKVCSCCPSSGEVCYALTSKLVHGSCAHLLAGQ
jgi:hypothetical protein